MKRNHLYSQLLSRVRELRRFIQVLAGPRQVGQTTLARQVIESSGLAAIPLDNLGRLMVLAVVATPWFRDHWRTGSWPQRFHA